MGEKESILNEILMLLGKVQDQINILGATDEDPDLFAQRNIALIDEIFDRINSAQIEKKVELAEWLIETCLTINHYSQINQWQTALREQRLLLHELGVRI